MCIHTHTHTRTAATPHTWKAWEKKPRCVALHSRRYIKVLLCFWLEHWPRLHPKEPAKFSQHLCRSMQCHGLWQKILARTKINFKLYTIITSSRWISYEFPFQMLFFFLYSWHHRKSAIDISYLDISPLNHTIINFTNFQIYKISSKDDICFWCE